MGTRRRRVSVIRSRSKPVQWDDSRMEFISNCTTYSIANAAKALIDGHLVAFPTETVYGLGADATNEMAVSRIYSVKGRPTDHPLIVHISSINKLEDWATDIPGYAIKLAREFWPGPMTLILPRTDLAKDYITGRQSNVGLRVPDQPIALALLRKFEEMGGKGVAAPSANRFGAVSATSAGGVKDDLGEYLDSTDIILNNGDCKVGIESTIVSCIDDIPKILRPGSITKETIMNVLQIQMAYSDSNFNVRAPGNFLKHYAPTTQVVINEDCRPGDGFMAISSIPTPSGAIRIASPNNGNEFAHQLYTAFRKSDLLKLKRIVVVIPHTEGIFEAIHDRLQKASSR